MKHKPYRGKMQIIRDILYALQHTPTTTHLVYNASTTGKFIKRWMPHMERQGLVIIQKKRKGFETYLTDKGRNLIKDFRRVDKALQLENFEKEVND